MIVFAVFSRMIDEQGLVLLITSAQSILMKTSEVLVDLLHFGLYKPMACPLHITPR